MHTTRLIITISLVALLNLSGWAQPSLRKVARERGITEVDNLTEWYGHGLALADYDDDGDIDFYLPTAEGEPDRLYNNDGNGFFTDRSAELGILQTATSRAALWLDFDGDHLLDLVVAVENCPRRSCEHPVDLLLFRQLESGQFTEVSAEANLTVDSAFADVPYFAVGGLAAGDLNNDHFLDLVFTVWGGGLKMFLNNGDGTFTDATADWSFTPNFPTPWQPLIHDFNGDGRMDIYCNVDFLPNQLWINKGTFFNDEATAYGLATNFNEMGLTIADYDNDRDLDLYVTNITRQHYGQDQRNRLLVQESRNGSVSFVDRGRGNGVSDSGWDWGTTFADLDNDGRTDLLTTNGWWDEMTYSRDRSRLWLGSSAGFIDASARWNFHDSLRATTLLSADLDRDGDQDILQTFKADGDNRLPLQLYLNSSANESIANNYLTVRPRMPGPNHYAIGSEVTVITADLASVRLITAGTSFYGQEPAEAHFGLGKNTAAQEVLVRWPDQTVNAFVNPGGNRLATLTYESISPPTPLRAILDEQTVRLDWFDESDNETYFEVQASADPTFATWRSWTVLPDETQTTDQEFDSGAGAIHYRVRACRNDVCSAFTNQARIELPELPVVAEEGELRVFPNPPVRGSLNWTLHGAFRGEVAVKLIAPTGQVLRHILTIKSEHLLTADLATTALPPGIYTLVAVAGDKGYFHKVVLHE